MARVIAAEYQFRYGLFVTLYIVFLIVSWVLTCYQAKEPFLLTSYWTHPTHDVKLHGIQQADADHATRFTYVLDGLSYLAAVVALPVAYEIAARAAVIYTLRTTESKQLNVAQLFGLADRNFIGTLLHRKTQTVFSLFALILILLALANPIVRGIAVDATWNRSPLAMTPDDRDGVGLTVQIATPNGWPARQIGLSPTAGDIQILRALNVMTRVRQEIIGSHPREWQHGAWSAPDTRSGNDRYFTTTIEKGRTTGMVRNLALRMDSEFLCSDMSDDEYPENCPGGEEFPYRHARLGLDICLQGNGTGIVAGGQYISPWANTTDKQRITEHLFIHVPDRYIIDPQGDQRSQRDYWNWESDMQCTVNTELAYFVLGNDQNNQTFSPKIDRLNETDAQIVAWAR